ncbi:MAG: glycosyltransferase [Spirochaetota bacterium]
MSAFNAELYIERAILSLLAQDFNNFELIIVDDGSTDSTSYKIQNFQDKRVRLIKQQNQGITKALNNGLSFARGQWIARHDADDFSIFSRFNNQVDFLNQNPSIELLGTSCFIQPSKHGIINEIFKYPESHYDIIKAFSYYNPFVHGTVLIKRTLLENYGGYNENYPYVQDYELWSRLIHKTFVHNLSKPLYVRTVHDQSSQKNINKQKIFQELSNHYNDYVKPKFLFDVTEDEILHIHNINFYPLLIFPYHEKTLISKTYYKMARVAKKFNLSYIKYLMLAFFYNPLFFTSKFFYNK